MVPLYLPILLPIVAAAIIYLLKPKAAKVFVMVFQLLLVAAAWQNFLVVRFTGERIHHLGGWPAYAGITLRSDLLAAVMVLLAATIFLAVILFDLNRHYTDGLFLFLLLTLEALIIGIFLSRDLFNIFVLVEVATIIISILIMYKKDSQAIYDGIIYLLMNTVAMIFFLFGLGILYKILGVVDLTGIEERIMDIVHPRALILPYVFIITAICVKSAMLPLFSWLPKAHGTPSAPGVVSAVLSGVYVKVGLYLFVRIHGIFSLRLDMADFFLLIGFATAVAGFVLALSQRDIKMILAYHTISQAGLIMMALNMGNTQAYWGGIYHMINHAFFKSTLFLTAGLIIDAYKTRDIYAIRGVFRKMPFVSLAAIFAVLGITGAPFFNGSISKYWIAYGATDGLGEAGLLLVNLGTVISFVKFSTIFFGQGETGGRLPDAISSRVAMGMGSMCLLGGILGQQFISFLFGLEMLIDPISYGVKILYFLGTLTLGILLYYGYIRHTKLHYSVHAMELSFNGMCMAIALFFGFTLFYLSMRYPVY